MPIMRFDGSIDLVDVFTLGRFDHERTGTGNDIVGA